ncbi:hypothetical protein ACIGXG_21955 [Streptomyces goshikiensis]|uniref:hypothetical protein n=1 Tax=Streptomyces goshikiensis TaxID=1942 RepID=UPI0037D01D41
MLPVERLSAVPLCELRSGRASAQEALAANVLGCPVDPLGCQMRRRLNPCGPLNAGDTSEEQAQVLTGEFTPAMVRSPDTSPVAAGMSVTSPATGGFLGW